MLFLFAKGVLLGLAIAAPVGPIGMLCINRSLERGFLAGVAGGLGTALADGLYAALAAAGFTVFSALLERIAGPLALAGGLFLLWLGWVSLQSRPSVVAATAAVRGLFATTLATFALTMANPATILSFAAIFAGLGLAEADGKALVVAGVFAGSMLWWILLSGGVSLVRERLPAGFARWTARVAGLVMIGFGVFAVVNGLTSLFSPA